MALAGLAYLRYFCQFVSSTKHYVRLLTYIDEAFITYKMAKNKEILGLLRRHADKDSFVQAIGEINRKTSEGAMGRRKSIEEQSKSAPKDKIKMKDKSVLLKEPLGWILLVLFLTVSVFFLGWFVSSRKGFNSYLETYFELESVLSRLHLTYSSLLNINMYPVGNSELGT